MDGKHLTGIFGGVRFAPSGEVGTIIPLKASSANHQISRKKMGVGGKVLRERISQLSALVKVHIPAPQSLSETANHGKTKPPPEGLKTISLKVQ